MDLYQMKSIREILNRHGFRFSKSLGQNFLTQPWVTEEIVERSEIDASCGVLEIGPGMGALTRELSRAAGRVAAVEVDRALLPVLAETLQGLDNVTVIHGDILKEDIPELVKRELEGLRPLVCANLPYYITSPILSRLIETHVFEAITVMLQKEVAERLCAAPGAADYGAFSVFIQYHTCPEILFDVPASCFLPQPKVDSAVVRLVRRDAPPAPVDDSELFFQVVRAAFAQRRKTLVNCLNASFASRLDKAAILTAVRAAGLTDTVRGETLGIAEFAVLARVLAAALSKD